MTEAQLLEEFLLNPNLTKNTKKRYKHVLQDFIKLFPSKLVKEITGKDILEYLQTKPEGSRPNCLWIIKRFLKFIHDEALPHDIQRIRMSPRKRKLRPQDLLTPEEVKRLLDACNNLRDKALIMTLYGTGARIGDFLKLKVGDIEPENGITRILISGKTGQHLGFVSEEAVPTLKRWLKLLAPENPDQYVFPIQSDQYKHLCYTSFRSVLEAIVKRAGIKKRVYAHLFRHMRNTFLVRNVGRDKARRIMGYAPNSPIIDRYTHLTDQDTVNAFLESEGLPLIKPVVAQKLPESEYSHPLTRDGQEEIEELKKQLAETKEAFENMTDKVYHLYNRLKDSKSE